MRAIAAPIRTMDLRERRARCEAIEGRLRSRCCGLIEVVDKPGSGQTPYPEERQYYDLKVQVLHKSVLDFLVDGEIWTKLRALTPKFDPNLVLIAASLLQVKTFPSASQMKQGLKNCLAYGRLRERSTRRAPTVFVDELNRVVSIRTDSSQLSLKTTSHLHTSTINPSSLVLREVINAGLFRYLNDLIHRPSTEALQEIDIASIIPAMVSKLVHGSSSTFSSVHQPFIHRVFSSVHQPSIHRILSDDLSDEYPQVIQILLKYLSNPANACHHGFRHAWVYTFLCISGAKWDSAWEEDQLSYGYLKALLMVVEAFLMNGADINASGFEFKQRALVAYDALRTWLRQISGPLTDQSDEGDSVSLDMRIDILRGLIDDRQATVAARAKMLEDSKKRDWVRFLSTAMCKADTLADSHPSAAFRSRSYLPNKVVPGGPFELDSGQATTIFNQLAGDTQHHLGKPTLSMWTYNPPEELSLARSHWQSLFGCASLPWSNWLRNHYFDTCENHPRGRPIMIRLIPGGPFEVLGSNVNVASTSGLPIRSHGKPKIASRLDRLRYFWKFSK